MEPVGVEPTSEKGYYRVELRVCLCFLLDGASVKVSMIKAVV